MRTGNPALNEKTFQQFHVPDTSVTMTLDGTVLKTGILLLLVVVAAAFSWGELAGGAPLAIPFLLGGLLGGLVFALVTICLPMIIQKIIMNGARLFILQHRII